MRIFMLFFIMISCISIVSPQEQVKVNHEFEQQLSSDENSIQYPITIVNGTGPEDSINGGRITITARSTPTGMKFSGWRSNEELEFENESAKTTWFSMPDRPVSVTAYFVPWHYTFIGSGEGAKHLFILAGQSNMERLNPVTRFIPSVETKFGNENIIVVKYAVGGTPIQRWFKEWKLPERFYDSTEIDNSIKPGPKRGDLYDSLLYRIENAITGHNIKSVTLIWMQGERDARQGYGAVYEESLIGLYDQISKDLGRKDINFIIGRLSDWDPKNENYPDWTVIRDIQVKVADSNSRFNWVNTDDLNDLGHGKNDLHYTNEGYNVFSNRIAEKAIGLIKEINKLTQKEKNEGWQLLFNGVSIDNWKTFNGGEVKGWKVIDGVLYNSGKGRDHGGDIITKEKFKNFILLIDWKIGEKSNSGIFYRVEEGAVDVIHKSGPEYQLLDDQGWPNPLQRDQYSGAAYAMYAPENAEVKPVGEWNHSKIVVSGAHVEHWLNGTKVVEYELWCGDWKERKSQSKWKGEPYYGLAGQGHIGLQDHGGLTMFRNIKIKEL